MYTTKLPDKRLEDVPATPDPLTLIHKEDHLYALPLLWLFSRTSVEFGLFRPRKSAVRV